MTLEQIAVRMQSVIAWCNHARWTGWHLFHPTLDNRTLCGRRFDFTRRHTIKPYASVTTVCYTCHHSLLRLAGDPARLPADPKDHQHPPEERRA